MAKVIVERPRYSGGSRKRKSLVNDDSPKGESIKACWRSQKELNENLNPLMRFMRSAVGRPWSEVYAEICERVNLNSGVQLHILQHLLDWVEQNVEIRKVKTRRRKVREEVYDSKGLKVTSLSGYPTFYVHPETGILLEAPKSNRWRLRQKKIRTKSDLGGQKENSATDEDQGHLVSSDG
jgi:hypothetical protein